jgi:glutathione S-transferase
MLKLYYSPGACSLAPHILLEELGLKYQLELVALAENKQQTPGYLAINPKGRVPALLTHEGEVLTEAPAVSWYIALQATHASLIPHGTLAQARCLEWFNWISGTVHAMAYGQLWRPHRFVADEALYGAVKAKGQEMVLEHYASIERRLADRDWAVGNAYTLVDPYLLVFYRWGERIGLDMRTGYPGWTRHAERMIARAAVQRALQQEGIQVWNKAA